MLCEDSSTALNPSLAFQVRQSVKKWHSQCDRESYSKIGALAIPLILFVGSSLEMLKHFQNFIFKAMLIAFQTAVGDEKFLIELSNFSLKEQLKLVARSGFSAVISFYAFVDPDQTFFILDTLEEEKNEGKNSDSLIDNYFCRNWKNTKRIFTLLTVSYAVMSVGLKLFVGYVKWRNNGLFGRDTDQDGVTDEYSLPVRIYLGLASVGLI